MYSKVEHFRSCGFRAGYVNCSPVLQVIIYEVRVQRPMPREQLELVSIWPHNELLNLVLLRKWTSHAVVLDSS